MTDDSGTSDPSEAGALALLHRARPVLAALRNDVYQDVCNYLSGASDPLAEKDREIADLQRMVHSSHEAADYLDPHDHEEFLSHLRCLVKENAEKDAEIAELRTEIDDLHKRLGPAEDRIRFLEEDNVRLQIIKSWSTFNHAYVADRYAGCGFVEEINGENKRCGGLKSDHALFDEVVELRETVERQRKELAERHDKFEVCLHCKDGDMLYGDGEHRYECSNCGTVFADLAWLKRSNDRRLNIILRLNKQRRLLRQADDRLIKSLVDILECILPDDAGAIGFARTPEEVAAMACEKIERLEAEIAKLKCNDEE